METTALFGSEQKFTLQKAILIYSATLKERGSISTVDRCAATVHNVRIDHGKPVLEAGAPVTSQAVESLATALGNCIEAALLPENILCVTMSKLVWWTPASRRRIWFNPSENTKDRVELKKLNGRFVQQPPLLFLASRGLTVFALAANRRPNANTTLYRAPYFNLDEEGYMCNGNVQLPSAIGPQAAADYEKAFFNSAYSHSNWGHKLTRHPAGHLGLWQEMAERKSVFPTRYLVRTQFNVTNVIKARNHD